MRRELLGKAHKPELDNLSPAQVRVVCEHLLYTMGFEQREKLVCSFPGLYLMIYPNSTIESVVKRFQQGNK